MKAYSEESHRKGLTIEQLAVGQTYQESFVITAEMIESFAHVTRERNPIHLDEDYAKGTIFGTRVAQGMLQAAIGSAYLVRLALIHPASIETRHRQRQEGRE